MGAALETEPETSSQEISLHLLDSPESKRKCCGVSHRSKTTVKSCLPDCKSSLFSAALTIHPELICTCEREELSLPSSLSWTLRVQALLLRFIGARAQEDSSGKPSLLAQPGFCNRFPWALPLQCLSLPSGRFFWLFLTFTFNAREYFNNCSFLDRSLETASPVVLNS